MSVHKHPKWPGWWVIDYRPEGRGGPRVRENFKGDEEAAKAYERQVRGIHVSAAKATVNPPFRDIASEFKTWATLHRKASYVKSIGYCLDKLLPHFGLFPPSRITSHLIERFTESRKHVPRKCNQELEMLQIIINWGADTKRNYCKKLPFKIDKLPVFKNLPMPPEPKEMAELLDLVEANFKKCHRSAAELTHKRAMVQIMYETGIRWIECRHLKWEHVRWSDGRLYLGQTKTNKGRFTVLSPEVLAILEPIKQAQGYMFINPRTEKPYTTMGKSLRENAKKLGIRLKGTHTLRHALGTDSIEASGDLRVTQELLGHDDIKSTTIYTHVAIGNKQRSLEATRQYRREKQKLKPPPGPKAAQAETEYPDDYMI